MFPCTKCGACCRKAWMIKDQFKEAGIALHADGSCTLLIDNKCSIYKMRPSFCRIDGQKPDHMTKEQYYDNTANFCNFFQEVEHMPQRYRVKL